MPVPSGHVGRNQRGGWGNADARACHSGPVVWIELLGLHPRTVHQGRCVGAPGGHAGASVGKGRAGARAGTLPTRFGRRTHGDLACPGKCPGYVPPLRRWPHAHPRLLILRHFSLLLLFSWSLKCPGIDAACPQAFEGKYCVPKPGESPEKAPDRCSLPVYGE